MDLQELKTLLDYHYWARDRVLDAARRLAPDQFTQDVVSSFRSVRDTLAHMFFAEWIWYSRWQGKSPSAALSPDQFPDVASIAQAWAAQESKVRAFVDSLGDAGVRRRFEYTTLGGQSGNSIFQHMLQHVVNHASYHRGQVTTMLRQLGAAPPKSMDMIGFYRDLEAGNLRREG